MTASTVLFAIVGSLVVWQVGRSYGPDSALWVALGTLGFYFLWISIYVDTQLSAVMSQLKSLTGREDRQGSIVSELEALKVFCRELSRQLDNLMVLRDKVERVSTHVSALDKWKEEDYLTHRHTNTPNISDLKRVEDEVKLLGHKIGTLSKTFDELKEFPLLKIETTKATVLRLQEILDTYERVQNAQAHMGSREWMLDRESFLSGVGYIRAMYRDLGKDVLPEDVEKILDQRIKHIASTNFKLADDKKASRNQEAERALFEPPPKPRIPIDEREIMALDSD